MTADEKMDRLIGIVEAQSGQIGKIVQVMEGFAVGLQRLSEAQTRTEQRLEHFIQATETRHLETTEKLDALVRIVDEWIRSHPSGGPALQ